MRPLLVAIASSRGVVPHITDRLRKRLVRRGLRVQLIHGLEEASSTDTDIILMPCRLEMIDQLAEQIEQGWAKEWTIWYASRKSREKQTTVDTTVRRS